MTSTGIWHRNICWRWATGGQPFVVFKHTDIDRSHIHIVSVCLDENGKKISDKFEKMRSMNVCRELERKHGLIPATDNERNQAYFDSGHVRWFCIG